MVRTGSDELWSPMPPRKRVTTKPNAKRPSPNIEVRVLEQALDAAVFVQEMLQNGLVVRDTAQELMKTPPKVLLRAGLRGLLKAIEDGKK